MEENKKSYKKLSLILTIATCIVCSTVFTVLCAIGLIPIPVGNGKFYNLEKASAIKKACRVEDEATLRKLLLMNDEFDIVVTKDIEIKDTLLVKGTKKLYGDATIYTDISGEFKTMYMMDVQVGASLTWDGPTLDSDGSCDGINVNQKAELHIKSGTIQFMRDAVYSNGTVTMTGGLIQHVSQNGIVAAFRSKVYVNGGILYNGGNKLLNVATNGYAEVNEGATFKASRSDAIFNAGELNVYGGTICDTTGYGINTEGKMNIEYKGEKKDGYIEMYDIGTIAVRMTSSEDCYISDVHAVNVGTNGVYTTDLRSNGKTTVENCIFDTCAINDGAAISISRKVVIKDVQILNSQGGGISCRTYGNLKIDGLVIDGTKTAGFSINDKFEGKNITISNVGLYNVVLKDEAEASFVDCVFGKSKQISVTCAKNSTLNLENVQIEGVEDEGAIGVRCSEGATLNMLGDDNVISGATAAGVCLLKDATLNMEGGKICDNQGKVTGAGVWLRKEGATFNMHGGTICNNTTSTSSGAVFVADKATFNMYGGTISGNKAELSGGAIGVQGVMNMSGGTISGNHTKTAGGGIVIGNNTKKNIYGTLNMTGGTIANNEAGTNGGGINVSGKTTAKISGGTIKDNKAEGIGAGISDNGYLTISKNACITGNDVGLVSRDVVMKIAGNSLGKHNSGNPLVVTPHFKTEPNKYVVIECDNESAAASMVNQYVKSGSKAYTLLQKEDKKNQITVNVNEIVMDLDTTDAETVYVTNFKQLKEAVQTTKTKRNIVLGADITMESLITVPAGTVVKIRDDGHTRTLSRNEKHTALFFETWYGTGLVLEGTSEGKLVLDGKTSGEAILKNVNSLVRVRGTSEFTNVAFQNNGNAEVAISGAFIRNEYGYATVSNCSFTKGTAKYGAAIYSCGDKLTVTDSVFTNNNATEHGGAIGISKTTTLIENSTFKNNTAAGSGGAIYNASKGNLTLKGTTADAIFEGNKVNGALAKDNHGGGALCATSGNVTIAGYTFKENTATNSDGGAVQLNSSSVVASMKACTFTGNKTVDTDTTDETKYGGGAILSKSKIAIADSTFTGNTASDFGGAICMAYGELNVDACTFDANTSKEGGAIQTAKKAIVTKINDSVFKNNTSTNNGGAICNNSTSEITIADCTFGGKNAGNKAKNNGGAIYHINGAKITLKDNNADIAAIFQNNKAENYGGAICLGSGTLEVTGYEFVENEAKYGGAVRLNGSVVNVAILDSSVFKKNIATEYGGAINNASKYTEEDKAALTILNCTFGGESAGNEAKSNGGAIFSAFSKVELIGTKKDTEVFRGNKTTDDTSGTGGAIYVLSGTVDVSGYQFANNKAANGGAIAVGGDDNATGTVKASNCTFDGNEASVNGGAIHLSEAAAGTIAEITNSTFVKNTTLGYGGAIFNRSKKSTSEDGTMAYGLVVDECTFGKVADTENGEDVYEYANTAINGTYKYGGAIYTGSGKSATPWGNTKVVDSNFYYNKASDGGAIGTTYASNVTIEVSEKQNASSLFKGNDAYNHGGAIFLYGYVNGTVEKCKFEDNHSTVNGGALYADKSSNLDVTCSKFTNNTADSKGGAICNAGSSTTTIKGDLGELSYFDNNHSKSATEGGGALSVNSGTVNVSRYTFKGNDSVGNGGAIYQTGALTVTNTNFITNEAALDGGAIYTKKNMKVTGCTFGGTQDTTGDLKNTATGNGGAICVVGGTTTLSTPGNQFLYNEAANGGAICVSGYSVTDKNDNVTNYAGTLNDSGSTFTGNRAAERGGAIHNIGNSIKVSGTTFANNTAIYGGAINNEGSKITATSCHFTSNKSQNATSQDNTGRGGGAVNIVANSEAKFDGEGTFTSNSTNQWGGAIYMTDSKLEVSGYTFNQNSANYAGAIFVDNAQADDTVETTEVKINNSVFTKNTSTKSGGVSYVNGRKVTFEDCKFGGTSLGNTSNEYGGVLALNKGAIITFTGTDASKAIMEGNTAANHGGAIYVLNGKLSVSNYQFVNNNSGTNGGAIYTEMNATVTGSTFTGNTAVNGGGIYIAAKGIEVSVSNSLFTKNQATTGWGGAIYTASTMVAEGKYALSVSNCTFGGTGTAQDSYELGNKAVRGGAIWSGTGKVKGEKCNFISNKATDRGGALCVTAGGPVSFNGGKFEGNGADTTGGAILKAGAVALTITGMQFTGNTNTVGTIRNANGTNPILKNCTLGENQTTYGNVTITE